MKTLWANTFVTARDRLHVNPKHVERMVTEHDAHDVLTLATDSEIHLFLKRYETPSGPMSLLVHATKEKSRMVIRDAFKLKPGLADGVTKPLELLRALVERFGHEMNIGGQRAVFAHDLKLSVQSAEELKVTLTDQSLKGRPMMTAIYLFRPDVEKKTEYLCRLGFSIDGMNYANWVNG